MRINHTLKESLKDLDIAVSTIGLVATISIFFMLLYMNERKSYLFFSAILITSFIFYKIYKYKIRKNVSEIYEFHFFNSKKFELYILFAFFSIVYTLSIFLLYDELYYRPLLYFILIALSCGIIAIEILFNKKKEDILLILLQIILVSLNIRWGIYYMYPSIYGSDPWALASEVGVFEKLGRIPTFIEVPDIYVDIPIFPLLITITKVITSFDVKSSFFFSISLISVFATLFVFLIGKKVFNQEIGLLAMLLINTSEYFIQWGIWIIPTTLGQVFFTIILFLLFTVNESKKLYKAIGTLFFLTIMVLTHTVSTFATIFVLSLCYISKTIVYKYKNIICIIEKENINVTSTLMFFSLTIATFFWMNISFHQNLTFFDFIIGNLHDVLFKSEFGSVGGTNIFTQNPVYEILTSLGYTILIFFSIFGSLVALSRNNTNSLKLTMVIIFFGLFALIFLPRFVGSFVGTLLIPDRWYIFKYAVASILASVGIFEISKLLNSRNRIVYIFLIIIFYTFLMVAFGYNPDSPIYPNPERDKILALKSSELEAANFINMHFRSVITDNYYGNTVIDLKHKDLIPSKLELNNNTIVIRDYILKHSIYFDISGRTAYETLNNSVIQQIENEKSYIYNSGAVGIYQSG